MTMTNPKTSFQPLNESADIRSVAFFPIHCFMRIAHPDQFTKCTGRDFVASAGHFDRFPVMNLVCKIAGDIDIIVLLNNVLFISTDKPV